MSPFCSDMCLKFRRSGEAVILGGSVFLGRPRPRRAVWEVPASARGSVVGSGALSSMSIVAVLGSGVLGFGPLFLFLSSTILILIFRRESIKRAEIRAFCYRFRESEDSCYFKPEAVLTEEETKRNEREGWAINLGLVNMGHIIPQIVHFGPSCISTKLKCEIINQQIN